MRKQIFEALCRRIKNEVPAIEHIDIWNNNITGINEGKVWKMPSIFIEFESIEWKQQGNRTKMGDIAVRLHIITRAIANGGFGDKRLEMSLAYFDLIEKVCAAVHGFKGDNFSAFQHTSSDSSHDVRELVENVERFVCRAQDTSALSPTTRLAEVGEAHITT